METNDRRVGSETSRHCRVQRGGYSTYYDKADGVQEDLPSQPSGNSDDIVKGKLNRPNGTRRARSVLPCTPKTQTMALACE
jgi:hypothetical protein